MSTHDAFKDIAYGGIAGSFAKIIEFPFDTIKVRLQSTPNFKSISTWKVIKLSYTNEGFINGFYKGLKAPMIGAFLESAVLFVSYNHSILTISNLMNPQLTKSSMNKSNDTPLWIKSVSGGISGFMAAFILSPVELIKCKLQVANLSNKSSYTYSTIIKQILKNNGVTGLWSGLSSTILRESGGTSIWFTTYELSSSYLAKNNSNYENVNLLFSGALSGVFFNLSMFPIDTIKSNIQTFDILHNSKGNRKIPTFWQTSKYLFRNGGVRSLYHGLGITLLKSVPANALIFYVYEVLKKNF